MPKLFIFFQLIAIVCTALACRPAFAASEPDFRITAPKEWKKISEDSSGGVFAKSTTRIVAVTHDLEPSDRVSNDNLFQLSKEIGLLRAAKMAAIGLANYALLEARKLPAKDPGIDAVFEFEARYLDFSAHPVQVIERQYFSKHRLFQVLYLERGEQIANRPGAVAALENFRPVVKRSRLPASETKESKAPSAGGEISNADQPRLPKSPALSECESVPKEKRRTSQDDKITLENLGKVFLGCAGSIGLPMDWEGWKKLDETDLIGVAATKTREGLVAAYSKLKEYWNDSSVRAETNTSIFAFAEGLTHPIEISKRIVVALSQFAAQSWTEWPCLNETYRAKLLCEIAGALGVAKGGLSLAKLGLGKILTLAERRQIEKATEEALKSETAGAAPSYADRLVEETNVQGVPLRERQLHMTPADVEKMEKLAADPQIPPHELPQKLFDVYKEARLRSLNPKQRAFVEEALKNSKDKPWSSRDKGLYSGASNQITIYGMTRTELEYFKTFAHELEHAIQTAQDTRVKQILKLMLVEAMIPSRYHNAIYMREFGAIKAEYDFLRSIPDAARERLKAAIHGQTDESKSLLQRLDAIKSQSFADYQRTTGYANMVAVRKHYPFFWIYPLAVGGATAFGVADSVMNDAERAAVSDAREKFIRFSCVALSLQKESYCQAGK